MGQECLELRPLPEPIYSCTFWALIHPHCRPPRCKSLLALGEGHPAIEHIVALRIFLGHVIIPSVLCRRQKTPGYLSPYLELDHAATGIPAINAANTLGDFRNI